MAAKNRTAARVRALTARIAARRADLTALHVERARLVAELRADGLSVAQVSELTGLTEALIWKLTHQARHETKGDR